jgi:hypothetical protein
MSDMLIQMDAEKRREVGFEAMDSQIDYPRTCCATMGCMGDCHQGRKECSHMPIKEAASSCTELGADDYSEADEKQSRLVTVVLVVAIWVLALPAAWFGVAHLFKTMVEAAP